MAVICIFFLPERTKTTKRPRRTRTLQVLLRTMATTSPQRAVIRRSEELERIWGAKVQASAKYGVRKEQSLVGGCGKAARAGLGAYPTVRTVPTLWVHLGSAHPLQAPPATQAGCEVNTTPWASLDQVTSPALPIDGHFGFFFSDTCGISDKYFGLRRKNIVLLTIYLFFLLFD